MKGRWGCAWNEVWVAPEWVWVRASVWGGRQRSQRTCGGTWQAGNRWKGNVMQWGQTVVPTSLCVF